MVGIPRENLDAKYGHQYDFANKVSGCVTGDSNGEPWMVCRELITTIQDTSPDTATVIIQVKELKTVGGPPDPSGDNEFTETKEYPELVEFDRSDVPLYNGDAMPKKFAQSDKDWPFPGEATIPLVKNWHTRQRLRIDTSDLD